MLCVACARANVATGWDGVRPRFTDSPSTLVLLVGMRPHHPHQRQALLRHAAGFGKGGLHLGRYPGRSGGVKTRHGSFASSVGLDSTRLTTGTKKDSIDLSATLPR